MLCFSLDKQCCCFWDEGAKMPLYLADKHHNRSENDYYSECKNHFTTPL